MKEKIKKIFISDKTKLFFKKVFNKKTIIAASVVIILVIVLNLTYSLLFKIEGVVRKIYGNKITVVNFLRTETINTGDYKIDNGKILVGDKVVILKNISGDVIEIRDKAEMHGKDNLRREGFENGLGDNKRNNRYRNAGQNQINDEEKGNH